MRSLSSSDALGCFSHTYQEARERFCAEAKRVGFDQQRFCAPMLGALGESLSIDVASSTNPSARRLLLVNSGIHGVEGYYGSAVVLAWMKHYSQMMDEDVQVVLIHALNPYGFSHVQRVNEDNIDLNRNFIDFTQELPKNPKYLEWSSDLIPPHWSGEGSDFAKEYMELLIEANPHRKPAAIWNGQYEDASGLFWGGASPSWSNRVFQKVIAEHGVGKDQVMFVDLHTGFGDFADVEVYSLSDEHSAHHMLCEQIFSKADHVISSPYAIVGSIGNFVCDYFKKRMHISIVVECGTKHAPETTLPSIMADHWLAVSDKGDQESPGGSDYRADNPELVHPIKGELIEAFCPNNVFWKEKVLTRTLDLIQQGMTSWDDS